jgi:hypothetical protein
MSVCSSEQAIEAIGYLERSFGGYPISEPDRRPYLRMFVTFAPSELARAIDDLARSGITRRPAPADIAAQIHKSRPRPDTRNADPWPDVDPSSVSRHLDECRAILRRNGVRV